VTPAVPGFLIVRALGAGASGQVFLAREVDGLERWVALKVFQDESAWRSELAVVKRIEELRRAARSPHLVQSLATGRADGCAYLAFEYAEEGTLGDQVEARGPLPFGEALTCASQASAGLALVHADGLCHRDVKPTNLLVGADGFVRLADFGLSRPLAGTMTVAGSPAFAAPELIAGRPGDGRRLDVYGLGATLAYLLTGETMLPGRPDAFLLERHGVPRAVQKVVFKAMRADPGARYADAAEFQAALQALRVDDPPAETESRGPDPGVEEPATDEARRARAKAVIERTGYAAAAATLLPIPGSEWVAVLPLHVGMTVAIAAIYDVPLDKAGAADLLGKLGSSVGLSYLGSRLATTAAKVLLPGFGGLAGAPFMFAATLGVGAVTVAFFAREGALSEAELRAVYQGALQAAKSDFDPRRVRREPLPTPTAEERLEALRLAHAAGQLEARTYAEAKKLILTELCGD
jgi:serine/threonine-protein kinase